MNNNTNNSLDVIKDRYKNCNLLMPVATEVQLNPFYKYTVMEVNADVSENSGDIFKVGSIKTGESNGKAMYSDVFSPAKPLLMKLAAAAGIQFEPNNTYGAYISKNCYKAKAYGAMRMPDGTGKTHCDEKVINLDDEEDRFRLEFMDKSLEGVTDPKAAEEAAKLFKGTWVDSVNKYNKPCKAYKIDDVDRQKYIDRGVLVNMTLLRKTFAEKAMTGAILRVIRALIGLKGTYTKDELSKPFAIPRVTFSPDYNDPTVRQAMLEQGMNSVSNMFGAGKLIPSASSVIEAHTTDINFNPEEFADNAAFASDYEENPADDFVDPHADEQSVKQEQPKNQTTNSENNDPNSCISCGKQISEGISKFAISKFGQPLCMSCQKEA